MKGINENKKNRRAVFAAMIALLICASATGAAVFAARWLNQTNKTDNTVTVGQPAVVSVTGAASSGTILPGAGANVTTTFDVSITDTTGQTYKLVIKDIGFEFDAAIIGSERSDGYFDDLAEFEALFGTGYTDFAGDPEAAAFADFLKEFQVSYNGGAAVSLTEGMVLNAAAADATGETVDITATDDLLLIARGGTLTFTLALELA